MGGAPTGTVTFLFTDIEGSTRLWDRESELMRRALVRHDEIVRSAIERFDGHVFATGGDGFAAAFARSGDALQAAVEAQRALHAEPWADAAPIRVRMAAHSGEAVERDGDYFGDPVNRTARLLGVAAGGEIVCSEISAALCGPVDGLAFVRLGTTVLRGIDEPVAVMAVVADGLPPARAARDLSPVKLPRTATEFVGRADDLQTLDAVLRDHRLLTLTGSGGVGKTRLAVELAWRSIDEFRDGVWFVELAPVTDAGGVAYAVATTLPVRTGAGMSELDAIVETIGGREVLLVLDNCEHLLDAVADVVQRVLRECAGLRLIATSREALGLLDERVWRVRSLEPGSEGVALFEDRLARVDAPRWAADSDRTTIRAICERLDGIPLAIELAAARAATLDPDELLRRLDDPFRLLRGGGRGRVERHQTLRAALSWSYELLGPDEQLLLDQCAVFGGAFDLEAVEQVCRVGSGDELDVITSLVGKSLVVADAHAGGVRYRLLETVRQYAEERLAARGIAADTRGRHLEHYTDLAQRIRQRYEGPDEVAAIAQMDDDWDNFRAAVAWATTVVDVARGDIILEATFNYAVSRHRKEHADWNAAFVAACDPPSTRALGRLAVWAYYCGDPGAAVALATDALDRATLRGAPETENAWFALHFGAFVAGRLEEGAGAAEACMVAATDNPTRLLRACVCTAQIAIAREDRAGLAEVIERMRPAAAELRNPSARSLLAGEEGMLHYLDGDVPGAITLLERAMALGREIGAMTLVNGWATGLAAVLTRLGHEEARDAYASLIRQCRDDGDSASQWVALEALAVHHAHNGRLEQSAVLFGGLAHNGRATADFMIGREPALAAIRAEPDGAQWLATGATLHLGELVEYALTTLAS